MIKHIIPMKAIEVSVICPVSNEKENVSYIFETFKKLEQNTEVIFVEGGSADNTWEIVNNLNGLRNKHGVLFRAFKQFGKGKAEAVATGFNNAKGKYFIIVDADLSIRQKDLIKIISLLKSSDENVLASGNRLKGLPKPRAFYWLNYVGNYFFRYYYSLVLQRSILDISCGSKAMTRGAWNKIRLLRLNEGKLDEWGDIDWLYYAKRTGLSIKYVNVDYAERRFGKSKLQKMSTRLLFALRMLLIGIKIVLH